MIRHVVQLRFKPGTSDSAIDQIIASLKTLPPLIPEIRSYTLGRDLALSPDTSDFAIVADFDSVEDFGVYANHPTHLQIIQDVIKPHVQLRSALQFQLEPDT
jgi:hypothetical protein